MSQANVELVRAANAAWNRGDLATMLDLTHPDFEWHTWTGFPGLDPIYRGRDGFKKFERDFRGAWQSLKVVIDELHDAGDRVAALATFEAHGRDGIDVRRPIAWVTTVRDGLAVRSDVYGSWKEALEAVGLSE